MLILSFPGSFTQMYTHIVALEEVTQLNSSSAAKAASLVNRCRNKDVIQCVHWLSNNTNKLYYTKPRSPVSFPHLCPLPPNPSASPTPHAFIPYPPSSLLSSVSPLYHSLAILPLIFLPPLLMCCHSSILLSSSFHPCLLSLARGETLYFSS